MASRFLFQDDLDFPPTPVDVWVRLLEQNVGIDRHAVPAEEFQPVQLPIQGGGDAGRHFGSSVDIQCASGPSPSLVPFQLSNCHDQTFPLVPFRLIEASDSSTISPFPIQHSDVQASLLITPPFIHASYSAFRNKGPLPAADDGTEADRHSHSASGVVKTAGHFSESPILEDNKHLRHSYIYIDGADGSQTMNAYILEAETPGEPNYYVCVYKDCNIPTKYATPMEALSHIRVKHFRNRLLLCTACHATFMRKQDAVRHVDTMNRGKKYKCSVCRKAFSRKDYRDGHEARCFYK
ncbi:hypothetical protein K439DRAFT_1660836 [Ramaria rubella]|nr:hypothetical protein K439DRAFT_1660836 [Ramaria rubella]